MDPAFSLNTLSPCFHSCTDADDCQVLILSGLALGPQLRSWSGYDTDHNVSQSREDKKSSGQSHMPLKLTYVVMR